jgi:hypothetical protein
VVYIVGVAFKREAISGGLSGGSTNVHHINDNGKVIAYHRWGTGGVGDDVIVVMNFSINEKQTYRIGFPEEGNWYLIFNSDSSVYADDYDDFGDDTVATQFSYDGMQYSGVVDIAPYSVQIYSQVDNGNEPCVADITGDGVVNVSDLLAIISAWGTPNADITGDNMTDVSDLLLAIGEFGPCP